MYHFISLIFIFWTHIRSGGELQETILLLGNKHQPQTSTGSIQSIVHTGCCCSPTAPLLTCGEREPQL